LQGSRGPEKKKNKKTNKNYPYQKPGKKGARSSPPGKMVLGEKGGTDRIVDRLGQVKRKRKGRMPVKKRRGPGKGSQYQKKRGTWKATNPYLKEKKEKEEGRGKGNLDVNEDGGPHGLVEENSIPSKGEGVSVQDDYSPCPEESKNWKGASWSVTGGGGRGGGLKGTQRPEIHQPEPKTAGGKKGITP